MTTLIPVRGTSESLDSYVNRLAAALNLGAGSIGNANGSATSGVAFIVDSQGRPLITPDGSYAYSDASQTQFTAPVGPNIVQIDTQQLVDAAVATSKLATGAVTTTKIAALAVGTAQIADAAILTAKIGDLQVVNAKIADLAVTNAKISDLAVGKLTAGTIGTNQIYVGGSQFELDGTNTKLVVRDTQGSPVTRVEMGKLGAGTSNYGLTIWDASGNVIFSSGLASGIPQINSGNISTYIASLSVGTLYVANNAINDIVASYGGGPTVPSLNGHSNVSANTVAGSMSAGQTALLSWSGIIAALNSGTGAGTQVTVRARVRVTYPNGVQADIWGASGGGPVGVHTFTLPGTQYASLSSNYTFITAQTGTHVFELLMDGDAMPSVGDDLLVARRNMTFQLVKR